MNVRVCLVGMKTWRIENRERKICEKLHFSLLGSERKQERQKMERNFFPLDPNFLSSQFGKKLGRKKY